MMHYILTVGFYYFTRPVWGPHNLTEKEGKKSKDMESYSETSDRCIMKKKITITLNDIVKIVSLRV